MARNRTNPRPKRATARLLGLDRLARGDGLDRELRLGEERARVVAHLDRELARLVARAKRVVRPGSERPRRGDLEIHRRSLLAIDFEDDADPPGLGPAVADRDVSP